MASEVNSQRCDLKYTAINRQEHKTDRKDRALTTSGCNPYLEMSSWGEDQSGKYEDCGGAAKGFAGCINASLLPVSNLFIA
jgi:hypothetical protein